ncbi:DUF1559 domain-containing protein [Blastopirellula sp. J2-11]|uniref:DUF1559 domain-containing protein n=1 Tax=Blastopirellula sp. J2-11 TaxID=2943192 RepID=UPI0021C927F0|nr:DUF1559 domain-containing protein [Blastopirellula sp. J2-11]UUO06521.1 DUF1559 domain-containing protein [Blastopirellula sp. J2-11]
MNIGRHRGFTLLELLVVIGIICLLIALLLPATRRAGGAARRATCANNLKQLGLALHNYHDTYGHFPAAAGGTDSADDPLQGNANRLSGMVALLPFIEQNALYDQITAPLNVGETLYPAMGPAPWIADYPPWKIELNALECPSAIRDSVEFGQTNYAFCIGDLARDINQPAVSRGVFAGRRTTRLKEITDGISNTIMLGEIGTPHDRLVIGQFATEQSLGILETPRFCFKTVSSWDPKYYDNTVPLSTLGRGGRWADGSPGDSLINTILPPNSPSCAVGGRDAADGLYTVSSYHSGGVQVLLADAAVRFIAETIDAGDLTQPTLTPQQMTEPGVASPYGVWGALGTIDGGETIGDY